jgi:hypothetical protein
MPYVATEIFSGYRPCRFKITDAPGIISVPIIGVDSLRRCYHLEAPSRLEVSYKIGRICVEAGVGPVTKTFSALNIHKTDDNVQHNCV